MRIATILSGIVFAIATSSSWSCLWDYDTLEMERRRFPGVLELITGKFLRHSEEYYRWRIDDRLNRLSIAQSPELFDDLAVAYDKLGMHNKAIETATKCENMFPGRYETAANLGTFHIHASDFQNGIKFIDQALELNPDAHFGRERYQKMLVEYLLTKRDSESLNFPLDPAWPEEDFYTHQSRGFAKYCEEETQDDSRLQKDENWTAKALEGVLGMMRFGHHDSPILLEALGDLLLAGHRKDDSKRLAARAYLRAGASCSNQVARKAYRDLAGKAMEIHVVHDTAGIGPLMTVEELERRLQIEVRDSEKWYEQLAKRERDWISEEEDVDAEFKRVYYDAAPPIAKSPRPWTYHQRMHLQLGVVVGVFLTVLCIVVYAFRRITRSTRESPSA